MDRYALAFRVRPGAEEAVAGLLSDYDPPRLDVTDGTRLLATAVFMHGNTVVRNIEIEGDLAVVSRHIASDPNVRRIEAQMAAQLEVPYDPEDPIARQSFFRSRLMDRLMHVESDFEIGVTATPERIALRYPVKPGAARGLAQTLATADPGPMRIGDTLIHSSTLFVQGDDTLVSIVTIEGDKLPFLAEVSAKLSGATAAEHLAGDWTVSGEDAAEDSASLRRSLVMRTLLERDRFEAGRATTPAAEIAASEKAPHEVGLR